jgi:hypothetical protein
MVKKGSAKLACLGRAGSLDISSFGLNDDDVAAPTTVDGGQSTEDG